MKNKEVIVLLKKLSEIPVGDWDCLNNNDFVVIKNNVKFRLSRYYLNTLDIDGDRVWDNNHLFGIGFPNKADMIFDELCEKIYSIPLNIELKIKAALP